MKPVARIFLFLLFICFAVAASASGQWILPEQTAVIEEEAFLGVTADTVTFSDELQVIEARAFAESSIGSVALPAGLTYIADNAFENTEIGSLTAVPGTYGFDWARAHGFIADSPASDFTWEPADDSSAVITKYTGADTQVVVPALLGGCPVSGIGANAFSASQTIRAVTLPDSVTSIGSQAFRDCANLACADIGAGISRIGDYAFAGCSSLSTLPLPEGLEEIGRSAFESSGITRITLPDSIQSIGNYAWMNCTKLAVFRYPLNDALTIGNDFIFKNCPSLKTVTFPEGLTVIRGSFFKNLTALEEVSLPSTLKTIGGGAFSGCTGLGTVSFPDGLEEIGGSAFEYTAVTEALLPDSVRSIGNYAWMNCTKLAVFRYPLNNELTVGRDFIFRNCPALKTVILPEGLTVIRGSFFKNLTGLEEVSLPSTLKIIEGGVFAGCTGLGTVSFPDGLEEIGSGAFESTAVTEALLPDSVRSVGNYAWRNCTQLAVFRYPAASEMTSGRDFIFQNCSSLKTVIIPEGAVIITDAFFKNLNALEEITLPSTLRTIGVSAFESCSSLGTVSFPDGLEMIGGGAFRNTAVTEAVLPDSVRSVGGDTWDNCGQLALFRYPMNNELTCGRSGLFDSCPALKTVIIPEGVTRLAESFFHSAVSLEEVSLPSTLKVIEANVFNTCTGLAVLPLPDGLEEIDNGAFCNTAITEALLPDSVRLIGNDVWRDCAQLSVFRYPLNNELVTGGGGGNFKERFTGCVSLKSVTVPEGVTRIPDAFFRNAASLETVVLPSTLKIIGGYAFYGCTSLSSLPLPDGLEEIGACAFEGLPITEALLPDSVRLIGSFAWNNCTQLSVFRYPLNSDLSTGQTGPDTKERFTNCVSLKSIVVPEGVTKVPDGFFGYAASLEEVIIPYSATEIGSFVFHACTGLDHVYLSENVTKIGNAAFAETPTGIWTEYGAYALQYAVSNSIPYYYLSMNGAAYPSGIHYQGDPFEFFGYVRSNYGVATLTASIYSVTEQRTVCSVDLTPEMEECNLHDMINSAFSLQDLPLGEYVYTIGASTVLDAETFVTSSFTVVPQPLRSSFDNLNAPGGELPAGKTFAVSGNINTNYAMDYLSIAISKSTNEVIYDYSVSPLTNSFDLANANYSLQFSLLTPGDYIFRITVTANGETAVAHESGFKILSETELTEIANELDAVFRQSSTREYSLLRKKSVQLSKEAYGSNGDGNDLSNLRETLASFGFMDAESYCYSPGANTCGHVIAWKNIENGNGKYTKVFIIVCRGTKPIVEWISNFKVIMASEAEEFHYGFYNAASNVSSHLADYISDHLEEGNISDCKIWVTGHSRGAAVANILGGYFLPDAGFTQANTFVYTFACPNVKRGNVSGHSNIYNYNFGGDLVARVPLVEWGYSRYGNTTTLPNGDYYAGVSVIDTNTMNELSSTLGMLSSEEQVEFSQAVQNALAESGIPGSGFAMNNLLLIRTVLDAMTVQASRLTINPIRWIEGIGNITEVAKEVLNTHSIDTYMKWINP